MSLFSYVLARDYGFAPNPFHKYCTLATCKPDIRKAAKVGDWIIGTTPSKKPKSVRGKLSFVMQVEEKLSLDQYWEDPRFLNKRAKLNGSLKQAYGDNIYWTNIETGEWMQEDSHHSRENGLLNRDNLKRDTKSNFVLVGTNFKYFGKNAPHIPKQFRDYSGYDICAARGFKRHFPDGMVEDFLTWVKSIPEEKYIAEPLNW